MVIKLKNRKVVKIEGKDRLSFLQGLITNDVNKVAQGAIYTALLSPQGKFLFDFFVVSKGDSLYITPEDYSCDNLLKKLKIYKLRSDVTIELLEDWDVYADLKKQASLNAPDTNIIFADPRNSGMGNIIISPNPIEETGSMDDYDTQRIDLCIPDGSRDMPTDKAVILEYGLDDLNALDWNKGCYLGQELMARTKHRGLVRKKLRTVNLIGSPPENGETLFLDEKKIGTMRTSYNRKGLALLRTEMVDEAKEKGGKIISDSGKEVEITY